MQHFYSDGVGTLDFSFVMGTGSAFDKTWKDCNAALVCSFQVF